MIVRLSWLILLAPLALSAQATTASLDFGAARMRFADSVDATAVSFSPSVLFSAPRRSLAIYGTLSRLAGASSNSGVLDASLSTRPRGRWFGEVEAIAGGSAHSDGTGTGQLAAMARLHMAERSRGLWMGGGVGQAWDGAWRPVIQGDFGAWLLRGSQTLFTSVTPTVLDDTIQYADAFLAAHHEITRWTLDASLGVRAGNPLPTLPANRKAWGSLGATLWANPRLGVVASAGTYPVDFTQGFPGGSFLSIALRVRPFPMQREPAVAGAVGDRTSGVRAFEARPLATGCCRIRVQAPAAQSVEVTGDFTQWEPVMLTSEGGGWWAATLSVPKGTHEVNIRLDRGPWRAPPGLITVNDEFGGRAGLLVVPQ